MQLSCFLELLVCGGVGGSALLVSPNNFVCRPLIVDVQQQCWDVVAQAAIYSSLRHIIIFVSGSYIPSNFDLCQCF